MTKALLRRSLFVFIDKPLSIVKFHIVNFIRGNGFAVSCTMNKEVNYILQGFLLLLVIAGITGVVQLLSSLEPVTDDKTTSMIASAATSSPPVSKETSAANREGKALFRNNCASCHAVNKELVGPPLKGAENNVADKKILYAWIRNNQAVLRSGDPYYNGLFLRYNKTPMMVFPDLTDDEITAILKYIRETADR